jgi:hypothetical protein
VWLNHQHSASQQAVFAKKVSEDADGILLLLI